MSKFILNIKNLSKNFNYHNRQVAVLKNINFSLKKGELIALTGPSGSGKSTLLHLIAQMEKPSSGKILFLEKNLNNLSNSDLSKIRKYNISLIFQNNNLISDLNVIENVMLPILINRNENKAYEISKKILFDFGLEDRIDYKPLKLSGGEQQRVAIARSLVNNPDIILADEMTGNLDEETANNIFSFFINYIEQNKKTLVYVTHNKKLTLFADEIYNFTNKKLHLNNE